MENLQHEEKTVLEILPKNHREQVRVEDQDPQILEKKDEPE